MSPNHRLKIKLTVLDTTRSTANETTPDGNCGCFHRDRTEAIHKGLTSRPSRRGHHAHPPTDSLLDWCWWWPYAPWTKCSLVLSSSACCHTNTACSPRSRWQVRKVPWCSGFWAKDLQCGHWGPDQRLPQERQNPSARSHPVEFAQSLVRSPSHWRRGSWKDKPKCSVHGSADWNSAAQQPQFPAALQSSRNEKNHHR